MTVESKRKGRAKILFITGTDTGVGKTVVTALLLHYLRQSGCNALAIKPFCSGTRADVRLLRALQPGALSLTEANPFFFPQPVAPAVAGAGRRTIRLDTVLHKIRRSARRCEVLLVEGSGGLLVPLGPNYMVSDLISKLGCPTMVVSRNRLGTINHTLLTLKAMEAVGIKDIKIVLMDEKKPDFSARSNPKTLQKLLPSVPIFALPNLGAKASTARVIKINAIFLKIILARILGDDIFDFVLPENRRKRLCNKTG